MRKIIIIGAGGHSKVVIDAIEELNGISCNYQIMGLLDDKEQGEIIGYKVLGNFENIDKCDENVYFHIAIGNNEVRENIYNKYKNMNFITIIHPRAIVSKHAVIEKGCYIGASVVINVAVKIGEFTIINTGSIVEHECVIEGFSHISYGAIIGGGSILKRNSFIDMGIKIPRLTNV